MARSAVAITVAGLAVAAATGILSIVFYSESNMLRNELTRVLHDKSMLKQELDATVESLNSTKAELESSRNELNRTKDMLKSTSEELDTTRQRLSVTEDELSKSREELKVAKDELDRTRARLLNTEEELSMIREEHAKTLRTLEEVTSDYEALRERLSKVEGDLKEYTYREDRGDFKVSYSSRGKAYTNAIDPVMASLNARLKLPYDIPVYVEPCGDTWYAAYTEYEVYTQKVSKIVLCVEDLDETRDLVDRMHAMGITSSKDDAFSIFIKYVMYHEVGHAVIRIADLHTGSREESLVDDFAFYMLVKDGKHGEINSLLWLYSRLADLEDRGEIEVRDPSSLYLNYRQQYHDFSCLAYGAGIDSEHIEIGKERDDEKCKIIWYEVSRGWDRALRLWWNN